MAADGSVVINTRMNMAQAEKDLAKLKKDIEKTEDSIEKSTGEREQAIQNQAQTRESLEDAQEKLSELRKSLSELQEAKVAGDNLEKAKANATKMAEEISALQNKMASAKDTSVSQAAILDAEKLKASNMSKANGYTKEEISEQKKRVSALQAEWNKTENSIERYSQKIGDATAKLEAQKSQISQMESSGVSAVSANELDEAKQRVAEQQRTVNSLQSEWNKAQSAVERYDAQIADATRKLESQKAEAGQLQERLDAARTPAAKLRDAFDSSGTSLGKLGQRISGLAKRVFIFSLITSALRAMRTWLGNVIQKNSEAQAAFARLKGALLTLAQPLIQILIPALTTLANILTVIVTAIANLVSGLSGKTAKQSAAAAKNLYGEAEAIGSVGSAAEEAAGSLAGFDEINTIQTENAGGGGGVGGGAGGAEMPDFSLDSGITDRLKEIDDLVMLIGAGLALWKIGGMLPGTLGNIATILAGILLTVGGLLLFWNGLTDAWENGVDWLNLIEMIGGLAAAALGLYLIFGKMGAGIALVVGGIAMLVTAFHDAMENGWNLQNTLLAIAGLLATGLGFFFITGSVIPLVIAGIAALLLALTNATGHGEELIAGIQEVIEGFKDFFTGIFTGDISKAIGGVEKIIEGLRKAVFAVIDGVKDSFNSFLTWLDEKTGGKLHGIIEFVRGIFNGLFEFVESTLGGLLESLKEILGGVVEFISGVFTGDWDRAWDGIKNIFKGLWNGIVSLLEGAVNLIIKGINGLIGLLNKIHFTLPDWVPLIGGKSFGFNIGTISEISIPRLAQGAVIPPNREFMAVLGDQKSGTNIEAPLDTIKQALIEALKDNGGIGGGDIHITVELDGKVIARNTVKHVNDMTRAAGKPVLIY